MRLKSSPQSPQDFGLLREPLSYLLLKGFNISSAIAGPGPEMSKALAIYINQVLQLD